MREEKNCESNKNSKKLRESWPLQSLEVIWLQWSMSRSYADLGISRGGNDQQSPNANATNFKSKLWAFDKSLIVFLIFLYTICNL